MGSRRKNSNRLFWGPRFSGPLCLKGETPWILEMHFQTWLTSEHVVKLGWVPFSELRREVTKQKGEEVVNLTPTTDYVFCISIISSGKSMDFLLKGPELHPTYNSPCFNPFDEINGWVYPEVARFQFRSCTDWSAHWLRMRRSAEQGHRGEWHLKASLCTAVFRWH